MKKLDISITTFIKKVNVLSTTVLWDRSYNNGIIVKEDIINYTPTLKLAGPCFLVNVKNNILPIIQALDIISEDHILVVNDLNDIGDALLGDIIMTAAKQQNLAGIVVIGNIRDSFSTPSIGLPLWAKSTSINPAKLGEACTSFPNKIEVKGGVIHNGDWLVGDKDGVISLDRNKIRFIIKAAELKNKRENKYIEKLKSGERLSDLMNLEGFLNRKEEIIVDF